MKASWDIFCSVVDNFGDIGVTWRLARQLVAEHGQSVRLWVDNLQAFAHICPGADPLASQQHCAGVEVCAWGSPWADVAAADVVVEAFACELPATYRLAMRARTQPSLWLNLEYLSAEDWVAGCHGLPSLQPDGLRKFFYFPGFCSESGGLLRERDLLARREAFQQDAEALAQFRARLGIEQEEGVRCLSLFCYENAALGDWLDALAGDAVQRWLLLVPEGRVLGDVQRWAGRSEALRAGDRLQRGSLALQVLPFVSQDDYDRLLWSCDFNLVRGEDSLLRALWAGRPLLWDIYKQADGAHEDKLQAFAAHYLRGLSDDCAALLEQAWWQWNRGQPLGESWRALQAHAAELRRHARALAGKQAEQSDLAARLVHFCADWL